MIDEYGGTAGLVTFESLMERIVGDLGGPVGGPDRIAVRPDGSADIDGLVLTTTSTSGSVSTSTRTRTRPSAGYVLGRIGRRGARRRHDRGRRAVTMRVVGARWA